MSNVVTHDRDYISMSADVNDHAYAGSGVELDPQSGGLSITGIDPDGIADDGWEIVIANVNGTNSVTIAHDSSSSAAGNRFFLPDDLDATLPKNSMVWCVYKNTIAGRVGWWVQF